jgi:hypothetical protein
MANSVEPSGEIAKPTTFCSPVIVSAVGVMLPLLSTLHLVMVGPVETHSSLVTGIGRDEERRGDSVGLHQRAAGLVVDVDEAKAVGNPPDSMPPGKALELRSPPGGLFIVLILVLQQLLLCRLALPRACSRPRTSIRS